ncbi:phosphotransferase [Microbacterium suaedae]|uniref:phosphotransferase n=1 Tax=Microbacterium suaedae TaxID=2067813 RepID=UPI001E50179F|nr:phosphotransferase [Microbacterium suaedae]
MSGVRIPSDLAHVPTNVETPGLVAALPGGDRAEAVWRNGDGGLTFRLPAVGTHAPRHVKWQPVGSPPDLDAEAERLRWASAHATVPPVVALLGDGEGRALITETIPGTSAVLAPWTETPTQTARALGAGLRALHEALPVDECPWTWSNEDRLARIADADERARLTAAEPDPARLVVCHGDACAPNTLLDADGRAVAYVDLGALGVADFWADLAVLAMSTVWNYGEGVDDEVYAGYGVDADPGRIAFFRALWNTE